MIPEREKVSLPPLPLSTLTNEFKQLQRTNSQLNLKIQDMKRKEETARNMTFAPPSSHWTPRTDPSRFPSEYLLASSSSRPHVSESGADYESVNTERLLASQSREVSLSVVHCEKGKQIKRTPSTNLRENQIAVYLPWGSEIKEGERSRSDEYYFVVLSLSNTTTVK